MLKVANTDISIHRALLLFNNNNNVQLLLL